MYNATFSISSIITFKPDKKLSPVIIDEPWVLYYYKHKTSSKYKMSRPTVKDILESELEIYE